MAIKMKFITQFGILLLIFGKISCQEPTDFSICPHYCVCDVLNGRNWADCSMQRLISANVEVPVDVEVLDLSYNDITILDNMCLQHYSFLLNLTIAHSAIHTIDLDAFAKLKNVLDINLSYNRLEYVDERTFELNRNLRSLNLEGNKFMTLPHGPLIRSLSLQQLIMRNARINFLPHKLLSALPNLEQVDWSQNLLITIDVAVFYATSHLKSVLLAENPLICDNTLKQQLRLLMRKNIKVTLSDCAITLEPAEQTQKFERMQMAPADITAGNNYNSSNNFSEAALPQKAHKWRHLTISDELTENQHLCNASPDQLCQKYRQCVAKVSDSFFEQHTHKQHLLHLFNDSDFQFAFFLGAVSGITAFGLTLTFVLCIRGYCREYKSRRRLKYELDQNSVPIMQVHVAEAPTLLAQCGDANVTERVLVPSRRPRRSARRAPAAPQQTRTIARRQPDDGFFSLLFGRPTRHQYYRTINQHTATLVRRLSRSNLFNNRLSQHFLDRQADAGSPAPSTPSSPTTPTAMHFDNENETGRHVDNNRSETPPPKYGDIVTRNTN